MIDWVFLDVGNCLLDEDPLTFLVFRRHVEAIQRLRPDVSFARLLAEREARASAGCAWPVYEMARAYLEDADCAAVWNEAACEVRGHYPAYSPLVPGAVELLDRLAARFRLGLIANQGEACRVRLTALGLLDRFDIVAFSEDEGFAKPDVRLFERALEHARAEPSRCLMVGDRLENDVEPAAGLGMATAWVRWPRRDAKGWRPNDPDGLAYLRSLERSAARCEALWTHICPSLAVDDLVSLASALACWPADGPLAVGQRPEGGVR